MNERANDYVKEWLGAYVDGELNADRRAWVEDHLATCPSCRQELAELRALTTLLHADPAPAFFLDPAAAHAASMGAPSPITPAAFNRQVLKRLPRPVQPAWQRAARFGMRYLPLGLFGAWAFLQAVIWVSTTLLYGMRLVPGLESSLTSLAPGVFAWGKNPGTGSWLSAWLDGWLSSAAFSGLDGLTSQLTGSFWYIPLILIEVATVVLLAVIFFAWLAGLYAYRRSQSTQAQETA